MRSGSGVIEKPEVERDGHQRDAGVCRKPLPEVVAEHEDVHGDDHPCHRYNEEQIRDRLRHGKHATEQTWLAWASARECPLRSRWSCSSWSGTRYLGLVEPNLLRLLGLSSL